jgi:hypothetical protein
MLMTDIPFGTTDWASVAPTMHQGTSGCAYWRTVQYGRPGADDAEAHRSSTSVGAKLFIVD